jgi:hypothetical protein
MRSARIPNYFIVGAARCGTTSLFDYLGQHPEIHNSTVKEPAFFDRAHGYAWTRKEYLSLFEGAHAGHVAIGEASTAYFESPDAVSAIKTFNPEARVIISVREPVARLQSLYYFRRAMGWESAPSFEQALSRDLNNPGGAGLRYLQPYYYSSGIKRFFNEFGRDSVHVVVFEDWTARPAHVYADILGFLAVAPGFAPEFRVANPSRAVRFPRIQTFIAEPPRLITGVAATVLSRQTRYRISMQLRRWNLTKLSKAAVRPTLRERILDVVRPDVAEVSGLLDRDLSWWLSA